MLIERAAFERLGGFDPGFFMFYEDIDLCLRANEAGYADDRRTELVGPARPSPQHG